MQRESTSQWVNTTFGQDVTTNQSCQEIPSQNVDSTATSELDRIQVDASKLWSDQAEEDSEEGEYGFESDEEGPMEDQEQEVEEQSVNRAQLQEQNKSGNEGDDHRKVDHAEDLELQENGNNTLKDFATAGGTTDACIIQKENNLITHTDAKKGRYD